MITRCPSCGAWLYVRRGHEPDPCTACQVWAILNGRARGGRVQRYPHESRYGKAREARPSATTDGGAP